MRRNSVLLFLFAFVCSNVAIATRFAVGTTESVPNSDALQGSLSSREYRFITAPSDNAVRGFRNLHGEAYSKPCCVSPSPDRVDCFVRGPYSNVLHKTILKWETSVHEYWQDLHGTATRDVECITDGTGRIDVLIMGKNRAIYKKTFNKDAWEAEWSVYSVHALAAPSCASRNASIVDCVTWIHTHGAYHIGHVDASWSKWVNLGGAFRYPIACGSLDQSYVNCFGIGLTDNILYTNQQKSGKWSGWVKLSGWMKERPTVTFIAGKRIDVFGLGAENDVVHTAFYGNTWKTMVSLGGTFDSPPECVSTGEDAIHCFAVGNHSYLYRNSWNGETWSGWIEFPTEFLESPTCVAIAGHSVSCYGRSISHEILEIDFDFS